MGGFEEYKKVTFNNRIMLTPKSTPKSAVSPQHKLLIIIRMDRLILRVGVRFHPPFWRIPMGGFTDRLFKFISV